MSADNATAPVIAETDERGRIRVDCYVRSTVPTAVSEQITAVVERLETLRESGPIAEVRISQWPAAHSIADESRTTRDELVGEFERWAARHDYSLEPAFRRQEVPSSPLGVDDEPRERLRVPLVALAFYEAETDAEQLRGVVPCTEGSRPDDERTYTVDEWLTAVETKAFEDPARPSRLDQTPLLEG